MTTAFIGKRGSTVVRARVAVATRAGESALGETLRRSGHEVLEFSDWGIACHAHGEEPFDLVLLDESMMGDLPAQLESPVILVGERAGAATHTRALPQQTFEQVAECVLGLVTELRDQTKRCRELEAVAAGVRSGSALIGRSPIMRRLQGVLSRAADSDATVLIEGPTGSGKTLAARVLHCKSRRSGRPLTAVDSATLDADAMAATIERARETTLVLEHIDRLPPAGQSVLVKHLKERSGNRAAGAPRLVATTSAHLPELIARGAFREDLYYRLHAFPMVMPGLRERVEDIAMIAEAVLLAGAAHAGRTCAGFTPAAQVLLESMTWPGNVAQLEVVVKRAQALAGGAPIDREHLVAPASAPCSTVVPASVRTGTQAETEDEITEDAIRPFEEEEQLLLSRALRATRGNVRRAAQLLGIGRATLYRKIQQYRLRLQ